MGHKTFLLQLPDLLSKKTLVDSIQNAVPSSKNVILAFVHPGPANVPVKPNSEPHIGVKPDEQAGVPLLHMIVPLEQNGWLTAPLLDDEPPELDEELPPELEDELLEPEEVEVLQTTF